MIELSAENRSRLEQLADTLDLMAGESALILAVAPSRVLQERLRSALPPCCAAIGIPAPIEFQVPPEAMEVYQPLQRFLAESAKEIGAIGAGTAIVGLTEFDAEQLQAVLKDLNRSREQFRQMLALPLVLWVDDRVRQTMTRQINDFKTWTTTFVFVPEPELQQTWFQEQGQKIQRGLEQHDEFRPNGEFLEPGDAQELGNFLARPIEELQETWQLPPQLALELRFWQGRQGWATGGEPQRRRSIGVFQQVFGNLPADRPQLRGLVALHEAWAHRDLGQLEPAREAFDRAWGELRRGYGPEVWARWWGQRWQVWLELGQGAAIAAELEAAAAVYRPLVAAQGLKQWWPYLLQRERLGAEVAALGGNWAQGEAFTESGLSLWAEGRKLSEIWPQWQGERLRLGQLAVQAGEQLGGDGAAIEAALRETIAAVDPEQFPRAQQRQWGLGLVDLVGRLRQGLRDRGAHGEAFTWKQQQRQWELQFGLRAFMGAGQFQVVGAGAAVEVLFAASGRGEDVRSLVADRLALDAHKCLTIYGPSGVGKSTLVEAGLVPALARAKFPAGRRGVPVLVRVYEGWQGRVLAALEESPLAPLQKGGERDNLTSPLKRGTEEDLAAIYGILQRNAAANRVTVLVFDQFEEFFTSTAVTEAERQAFYGFIVECLRGMAVQYVKVVLSLREDYCDRLQALDRVVKAQGLATELFSEENSYYLGNFTKDRAKTVITALAERANYGLEPELVQALVADLATEGGLVRPVQLQVVGAQLQAWGVETVAQYEARIGGKVTSILTSTAPVVDGYVGEVVADCGADREQAAAWGILLGLTNAQGLRPIRSEVDVWLAVECFGRAQGDDTVVEADLELVRRVLTESGLVVTWGDPGDGRFQLVHDYLVFPIRNLWPDYDFEQQRELGAAQQREKLLMAENEVLAGASRKAGRRLAVATGIALAVMAGAGVYGRWSFRQTQEREKAAQAQVEAAAEQVTAAKGEAQQIQAQAETEVQEATEKATQIEATAEQTQKKAQAQVKQAQQEKAAADRAVAAARGELARVQGESAQVQQQAEAQLAAAIQRQGQAEAKATQANRAAQQAAATVQFAQEAT
ncbi:MAG: ATP-binding protein, partial [Prochlorothrix sp.]|nr:ATP-binding protein [Prochlorothrix sp.]